MNEKKGQLLQQKSIMEMKSREMKNGCRENIRKWGGARDWRKCSSKKT